MWHRDGAGIGVIKLTLIKPTHPVAAVALAAVFFASAAVAVVAVAVVAAADVAVVAAAVAAQVLLIKQLRDNYQRRCLFAIFMRKVLKSLNRPPRMSWPVSRAPSDAPFGGKAGRPYGNKVARSSVQLCAVCECVCVQV